MINSALPAPACQCSFCIFLDVRFLPTHDPAMKKFDIKTAVGWSPPSCAEVKRLYDLVGVSRDELAVHMGISRRTLFVWIDPKEKSEISFAHYRLLCDLAGVALDLTPHTQ